MTPTIIRSPGIWAARVLLFCTSLSAYAAEGDAATGGDHTGLKAAGFFLAFFLFLEFVVLMTARQNQKWYDRYREKYEPAKMQLKLQKRLSQQRRVGGAGLLLGLGFLWLCRAAFRSMPKEVGMGVLCGVGGLVLAAVSLVALRLAFTRVRQPEPE